MLRGPSSGLIDPTSLEVLRLPAFRWFGLSRGCASMSQAMLQALVLWQVYAISQSDFQLGVSGLVRLIPALGMSLVSGVIIDTYDVRRIMLLAQIGPVIGSALMLGALATGHGTLLVVYVMILITGFFQSFDGAGRQSMLSCVIPRRLYSTGITISSTIQSLAFVMGPGLGGILIAWKGLGVAYAVYGALGVLSALALLLVQGTPLMRAASRGVTLEAIREGIVFVLHRPVLLGAMTLDMFAVIFGGAKALLPVYAVDVLHAGPVGYGILSASSDAGALIMSVLLVLLPRPTRTGRAMLITVALFGLATVLFGLSTSLPLSVLTFGLVGMSDQLSVVMRQTMIQLSTPDELRGRVSAVNAVFVNSSNQLGAVESGFVAAATNAIFAVVSGGIGCLAVVGITAWRIPEMRAYEVTREHSVAANA